MIAFAVVLASCGENPLAAPGVGDPVAGGAAAAEGQPGESSTAGQEGDAGNVDTGNVSVTPMPPGQSPFEEVPAPAPAPPSTDGGEEPEDTGLIPDGVDPEGQDSDGDGEVDVVLEEDDGSVDEPVEVRKPEVRVQSDVEVENEVPAPDGVLSCADSDLPPGEGRANKAGTCVSTDLGEVRENPVFPVVNAPDSAAQGEDFTFAVQVVGNGPGLNGFTQEGDTGKAGITFLERMTLNNTVHCHTGAAATNESGAPLTATYAAAFSGLEGIGDEFLVTFANLDAGTYVGAVWCTGAGHVPLGTALASTIIPSTNFRFTIT